MDEEPNAVWLFSSLPRKGKSPITMVVGQFM
jgi:hypothetical protein